MYIHISVFIWITILLANVAVAGLTIWSLRQPRLIWLGGAFIAAWFAADLILGARGAFHYSAPYPFPYIAVGVLAPIAIAGLVLLASSSLRAAVNAIPQHRLVAIQAFRIVGFTFLILLAQHQLPAVFALPAGIGDIIVGVAALVVARGFYKKAPWAPAAGVVWNIAGIFDLVNAISIGFLASTTPLRLIFSTPATDVMSYLPMVMVPIFAIPLFMVLHGISLSRLISQFSAHRKPALA